MNIRWIRGRVIAQNYEITPHATEECEDEDIQIGSLEEALLNGKILEQYADRSDPRGDSCLVVGTMASGDPLHIVVSRGKANDMHIVN